MKIKNKLLFVLSNDFGELHDAFVFAEPLADKYDILFLLPPKLYDINYLDFPRAAKKYGSFTDLRNELELFKPAVCFLFSGYLLTVNRLLSDKELNNFIKLIKKLRIKLVTSDPWLNIWQYINTQNNSLLNFNDHAQLRVYEMFKKLSLKYADIYHIYSIPLSERSKKIINYCNKKSIFSFFRKTVLKKEFNKLFPDLPARSFSLFVISNEDASLFSDQVNLLADRVKDILEIGYRLVIVAPKELFGRVELFLSDYSEILYFSELSLLRFNSLLLQAKHVFYWNIFSSTIYDRLINRLPVFYFDTGHMAKYFPPFLEIGQKAYYGQDRLPMLDIKEKITLKKLNKYNNLHKSIYKYFYRQRIGQPAPNEVLRTLL